MDSDGACHGEPGETCTRLTRFWKLIPNRWRKTAQKRLSASNAVRRAAAVVKTNPCYIPFSFHVPLDNENILRYYLDG